MTLSFNKVVLVGRLTKDPKFSNFDSGKKKVVIRIAVNRVWGKKNEYNEKKKEETLYINCEAWEDKAENMKSFLKQGSPILVEGHLYNNDWTNEKGEDVKEIRLKIEKWEFMETKKDKDNNTSTSESDENVEAEETTPEDFDALVEKAVNGN